MSGGALGAEQRTLAIMVGGKAAAFEQAQAFFQLWGRATHVGPHGASQLAKLANQMIVGITRARDPLVREAIQRRRRPQTGRSRPRGSIR